MLLALPLVVLLRVFSRERKVRIDHELELRDAYRGTAFLLGDVIEADDAYTGTHSRDVVTLTLAVADELGLTARERRDAEFAALLHDVGKVRVPNEIINKPGPLTDEERKVIEQHTIEGERMLLRVGGLLGEIGRIVRACHERWDGTGYPDGAAGEEIPVIARIVCCCDAFNAMTSDRSYRKALPVHEAMAELIRGRGSPVRPDGRRCPDRRPGTATRRRLSDLVTQCYLVVLGNSFLCRRCFVTRRWASWPCGSLRTETRLAADRGHRTDRQIQYVDRGDLPARCPRR